jgi:uncharacterized repeat protein (TIGR01451 family)
MGGDVTFTITAANNGTVPEQPVIVLPRGYGDFTLVSHSCPGASSVQGAANSGWTCYYPPLAPGGTVTTTLTAQLIATPDLSAFLIACVAPADQISSTFNYPPGGCQTANVTVDPNLSGVGTMYADLQVDSITPSLTHAKPGDRVTYTIVASNHGRDAGYMFVITGAITAGISLNQPDNPFLETLCGAYNGPPPTPAGPLGVSADGDACEYGLVPPGTAVIDTYPAIVQGPGFATDTACADAGVSATPSQVQISPQYACQTAAVAVDAGSTTATAPSPATPTPTTTPAPILGPVTAPIAPSAKPAAGVRVTMGCPAYTERRSWRYTILTRHKMSCTQSRGLIRRADRVLRRTDVTVKLSAWACRREPVFREGHMWLDTCGQRRGALVIWTEQRDRKAVA